MTRLEICNALAAANCTLVGGEWCSDVRVEDAYYKWLKEGSPSNMLIAVEYSLEGREEVRIEPEEVPELL